MKYRILMRTKRKIDSSHRKVMVSPRWPVILEESEDRMLIQNKLISLRSIFDAHPPWNMVGIKKYIQTAVDIVNQNGKATVFYKSGKDWETEVILETTQGDE